MFDANQFSLYFFSLYFIVLVIFSTLYTVQNKSLEANYLKKKIDLLKKMFQTKIVKLKNLLTGDIYLNFDDLESPVKVKIKILNGNLYFFIAYSYSPFS